jgi:group I intron endonuclease
MIGIYKITNSEGKIYIGCTISWDRRLKEYQNLKVKGQSKIYGSLLYYGVENHTFEFIEECNVSDLYERELWWINYYNSVDSGLNIRLGGRNGNLTQDTKNKISEALKGRKNTWFNPNSKGHKYTEEQKQKMRKPRVNKWEREKLISPNTVEEIRIKYNTGNYTRSNLSREYGASWGTIKNITDKINSYK